MVKAVFTEDDDALLSELGVEVEAKKVVSRTPREERIIAGFEEIERFIEENGRIPEHGEEKDIFERLYAVRLDKIRASEECKSILQDLDTRQILQANNEAINELPDDIDDDTLLEELGVEANGDNDITKLKHVRTRAEIKAAEEIAQRTQCSDFDDYSPLFVKVKEELKSNTRTSRRFKEDASIQLGEFFILGGQIAYVAHVGEEIKAPNGATDARLRVIFDNGTESDLLMRSLQRALYKDEAGRRITDPSAGPLFSDEEEDTDIESGTIYVLRSNSNDEYVKKHREILHKIGVTGGDIKKRIANAKNDPTFLMADVEIIATYKLSNINRVKLENLIHKFFEQARLDVAIKDRFGKPTTPREWFLVPLFIIDEMVEKIKDGTLANYYFDLEESKIVLKRNKNT
jgi:hypothetical protein